MAAQVYDAIEASNGFYSSPVEPSVRSNMNIPFTIPSDAALEKEFLQEASKKNMVCCCAPLKLRHKMLWNLQWNYTVKLTCIAGIDMPCCQHTAYLGGLSSPP